MRFSLLGPLEVRVGGRPVPIRGDKKRAVLAVLLLAANRVVLTDELVDSLWGYRAPAGALGTLQSHVSHLRRAFEAAGIPGSRLTARSGGYELQVGPDELDVARFESLVDSAARATRDGDAGHASALYREALALWRGPALSGLDLPMQGQAARLEELRLVASEELFECELALGHHPGVVAELERLAAAHPLRERLWAQRMVALYRCGRQADALRTYHTLRATLREELGIEPSPEVRQLERDILLQSPGLTADRGTVTTPGTQEHGGESFPARLVGRERELALLGEWLDRSRRGQGGLVVIVGQPGIGKTALARSLSSRAQAGGVAVHWGRCWEEEGAPPFWIWTELLRSLFSSDPDRRHRLAGSEHSRLLCQLVPELGSLAETARSDRRSPDARFRLFEAVVHVLLGGDRARVLVIEDVHAADEPSLLLLRFLARRLAGTRLLVLVTARPVASPDGPLAGLLAEIGREPVARRLDLSPLTDDSSAQLLERELGPETVTEQLTDVLRARGEGNPLFLLELARLVASARGRGAEKVAAASVSGIPLGVADMVRRRLATLRDDTAQVLTLAAVAGREFSVHLLRQATSLRHERVLSGLEDAVHAGLLEEQPGSDGRYRFCHGLVRQVLYEGLSAVRRARLHARIADALAAGALGHPDTRLFELTHHCAAAGGEIDGERTLRYALSAAERAGRQLAFEEAARGYEIALEALRRLGAGTERRAELELARADALVQAGQVGRARESFEALARQARARGDRALLARAALGAGRAFEARATDETLVALLEEALHAGVDDPDVRARLLGRLAMALYFGDRQERRAVLSQEAVAVAERSGDTQTLAFALNARYFALWDPWHLEERQAVVRRALDIAEDAADGELLLDALTWRVMDALESGAMGAAGQAMRRHAHLADALRHPRHRSYAKTWAGMRAVLEGRFGDAERLADEAFAMSREITDLALPRLMVQRFVIRREQGRLIELRGDVDRVVADHPELATAWRSAQALVWEQAGDRDGAERILDDLVVDDGTLQASDGNFLVTIALGAELCARVGGAEQAETLGKALAPFADRCVVVRFAPVCLGAVSRYLGLLAVVTEDWEQAGSWFEDALARNASIGAIPWVAHTQHDYALALARQGRDSQRARAIALARRAAATARRCGMQELLASVEASGLAR